MKLISLYHPKFARALVYMLQSSEYSTEQFLAWFRRAKDLRHVAHRGQLDLTRKARLLLLVTYGVIIFEALVLGVLLLMTNVSPLWFVVFILFLLLAPYLTAYFLVAVLWLGRVLVQNRAERAIIAAAKLGLQDHPGLRIAVAGSYGKTSFKEMLRTILSQGKAVAATPGNMNTPIGISRFITTLSGHEEVIIFELGEYYPGDIRELSQLVQPDMGVITGINEAHLAKFKTIDRTIATIFELADFLTGKPVYKNGDNRLVRERAGSNDPLLYSQAGMKNWKVSDIQIGIDSTSFTASNGSMTVAAKSGLLGIQQVGPLVACIDIAFKLGLTAAQITAGIGATKPYEHRMQPRPLAGAWIIDDTYNGNSDGVAAGLQWLASVPATRRIYVTPGLVEQGAKSSDVHVGIGRQIAAVADVVVLFENSVSSDIQSGLQQANFQGELKLVADALKFYNNLDQFIATGDVVLMQNDWTDNYF